MRTETVRVRCIAHDGERASFVDLDAFNVGYVYKQSTFDAMDFYPTVGMVICLTVEYAERPEGPDDAVLRKASENGWFPGGFEFARPVAVSL